MLTPDFFSLSFWIAFATRRRIAGYFTRAYSKTLSLTNPTAVMKIEPQQDYYFTPLFVMASWSPGAAWAGTFKLRMMDDNLRQELSSQKNPRNNDTGIELTAISTPAAPGLPLRYLMPVEYVIRGREYLLLEVSGYTPGGAGLPANLRLTVWGFNQPVTEDTRVRIPEVTP